MPDYQHYCGADFYKSPDLQGISCIPEIGIRNPNARSNGNKSSLEKLIISTPSFWERHHFPETECGIANPLKFNELLENSTPPNSMAATDWLGKCGQHGKESRGVSTAQSAGLSVATLCPALGGTP